MFSRIYTHLVVMLLALTRRLSFLLVIFTTVFCCLVIQGIVGTKPTKVSNNPAILFPLKFSSSFSIRDRVHGNKVTVRGTINVDDIRFFNESSAILYMADSLNRDNSEMVIHMHRKNFAVKHLPVRSLHTSQQFREEFHCMRDMHDIPPMDQLFQSLTDMTKIDITGVSSRIFDREVRACINQNLKLFRMNFVNQDYVLCGALDDDEDSQLRPIRIIGQEFVIDFDSFSTGQRMGWMVQETQSTVTTACANIMKEKQTKSIHQYQYRTTTDPIIEGVTPWFQSYDASCRFNWMKEDRSCQQYERENQQNMEQRKKDRPGKVCIFLHGAGNTGHVVGPPVNKFTEYWGDVHLYTPQCSERWFIREDTKNRGWDDEELQRAYCKLALIHQKEGDTVIRDKIIFAHSMANIILADASRKGLCTMDTNSTSWYEIQGALLGSKAAQIIRQICRYNRDKKWPVDIHPLLVKWIITQAGYCMPGTDLNYPVYDTLDPSYPKLEGISKIAQQNVKGVLCGNSAFGLATSYSLPLQSFALYTGYEEENDAIVPWTSCDEGDTQYSNDYRSLFYSAKVNHADGTCRNGNGWWSNKRRPCSWYTDKT